MATGEQSFGVHPRKARWPAGAVLANVFGFRLNNIFSRVHGMYRNAAQRACNALLANNIQRVSHTLRGYKYYADFIQTTIIIRGKRKS